MQWVQQADRLWQQWRSDIGCRPHVVIAVNWCQAIDLYNYIGNILVVIV